MNKLWNYLNGKKTNIGAAFLFLSLMITDLVIGKLNYEPVWIDKLIIIFDWFGGILTGGGLFHKLIKTQTK